MDANQTHQKRVQGFHGQDEKALSWARLEGAIENDEAWFHALAKLSPVGIFRTDVEGDCLYVNERWCAIAGLTPREACRRKNR